jgi:hypothetical protein
MKIPDKKPNILQSETLQKTLLKTNSTSVQEKDTSSSLTETQKASIEKAKLETQKNLIDIFNTQKGAAAKVSVESNLESFGAESIEQERAALVAELKVLVASGKYFEKKNIGDIAQAVVNGLDEAVDILK